MKNTWMVIDVESIGLHGEAFAVGVVQIVNGLKYQETTLACPVDRAVGDTEDRQWVRAHCPRIQPTLLTPTDVRMHFWDMWMVWREQHGAGTLIAECGWPVETEFIRMCIADDPKVRKWLGPYPLHDLASMRLVKGFDPLRTIPRHLDELPAHHPLHDARQSARLLMELTGSLPSVRKSSTRSSSKA